jgi:hypothetical protein
MLFTDSDSSVHHGREHMAQTIATRKQRKLGCGKSSAQGTGHKDSLPLTSDTLLPTVYHLPIYMLSLLSIYFMS